MESVEFCGRLPRDDPGVHEPPGLAPRGHRVRGLPRGEGVSGWVESKMAGTRQLFEVAVNTYRGRSPRRSRAAGWFPITKPARRATGRRNSGRPPADHFQVRGGRGQHAVADRPDDDGRRQQDGRDSRQALRPGRRIRFVASDAARQESPGSSTRTEGRIAHLPSADAGDSVGSSRRSRCSASTATTGRRTRSRRPTRNWTVPSRTAQLPTTLPFLKKTSMEAIKATYATSDEAAQKIPAAIRELLQAVAPRRLRRAHGGRAEGGTDRGGNLRPQRLPRVQSRLGARIRTTWGTTRSPGVSAATTRSTRPRRARPSRRTARRATKRWRSRTRRPRC